MSEENIKMLEHLFKTVFADSSVLREDLEQMDDVLQQTYFEKAKVFSKLASRHRDIQISPTAPIEFTFRGRAEPDGGHLSWGLSENYEIESVDPFTGKAPYVHREFQFAEEEQAITIAGQDRVNFELQATAEILAKKTEIAVLQGGTIGGIAYPGLVSATNATDDGAPAGSWGASTGGKLVNAIADVAKMVKNVRNRGFEGPLDLPVTPAIYATFETITNDYTGATNLELINGMLAGGEVMMSYYLQAAPSATVNTAMLIPRMGPTSTLNFFRSGIVLKNKDGLYERAWGSYTRCGLKNLQPLNIRFIDAITTA